MATRQQLFSPVNSFIAGRQARQQEDYGNTRNALAQMELQNAPQEMQSRNKLLDLQTQGAEQSLSAEKAKFAYATLKQAMDSGNPKAFVLQHVPDLVSNMQRQGQDLRSMSDQQATQYFSDLAGAMAGQAGIAPAAPIESQTVGGMNVLTQDGKYLNSSAPKTQDTSYTLSPGQERWENGKRVASVPSTPATPKDERLVQIADEKGNPKWVRESDAVNQPAYVARDKPAAADLKYQREIRSKQPRLKAARRRVDRLSESILGAEAKPATATEPGKPAVKGIAQNTFFDGGPLDQYALAWSKQGQEVSQSKAALLSELTALTRVPGIGSQSDLETRLASLPFPSSEFGPEVNRKAVAEIQAFVADLEDAYGSVEGEFQSAEVQSLVDKYDPPK